MRRISFVLLVLPLLIAPGPCQPAPDAERGPYLQLATPSSVVVRWNTLEESDSVVRYGASPEELNQVVSDSALTTNHEVTVADLAANERYYYSVGSTGGPIAGGDLDHHFATAPTTGSETPTRIWAIGDSGTADANAAAVRDAYLGFTGATPTDVWLMLGDNAYGSGTYDEYQAAVFETYPQLLVNTPLWPTIGNHGSSSWSFNQTGPFFDMFTLPTAGEAGGVPSGTEAYYSFDHGNVHFVCLDSTGSPVTEGGAMLTWLAADLSASSQPWTIAFWHHPPYSKGSHDSDSTSDMTAMRARVVPILDSLGVDLVLTGHSHSYERSVLLDGHYGRSGTLEPSMVLDGGDGREDGTGAYAKDTYGPAPHQGAVYVVAGSSGKVGGGSFDHPIMVASLPELGSVVIDVAGSRLDASFLTDTGSIDDHFTLVKGP